MKIIVLGGDGFCGWPTSLHLSAKGHEVVIVDNLVRRKIDVELEVDSLTPIRPISERLDVWRRLTGREIRYVNVDVAQEYERLRELFATEKADAVIHFAEQRSAPYSMKSAFHKRYTVSNNVNATNNVLAAIVDVGCDMHVVHLGTMGVYGYESADVRIPEGYLTVKMETTDGKWQDKKILYPANPGSIYHTTKALDQLLFQFYSKNDGVRVTDLHQGIVWGTQTEDTKLDERLINRFDYDGDYGTVLNRFLVEAAVGHPLTVHGSGGQKRAFIHVQDMVRCIELALETPPTSGDPVKVINQMTEVHRIRDLAQLVADISGAEIQNVENPRKEAEENELDASNDTLLKLGLKPTTLKEGLLEEIMDIAKKYAHRCDKSRIPCKSRW